MDRISHVRMGCNYDGPRGDDQLCRSDCRPVHSWDGRSGYVYITYARYITPTDFFTLGLFPGLVYYLTFWYRTNERSLRVALILASATLGGAFGGAIAYGVGHMNGTHGLEAWRWLFILEGLPSCLSSIAVFFFLPDYPETVRWLSDKERSLAISRLKFEASHGMMS
jgi:MFS family permease